MRKVILVALVAAAAFGESAFEKATKYYLLNYGSGADVVSGYERACEQEKSAAGCFAAGYLHENGYGAESSDNNVTGQDPKLKKAMAFYDKACDMGDMDACGAMGEIYAGVKFIEGVEIDYAKANNFYKRACDGKIGSACLNLGKSYDSAMGVTLDYAQAAKLYRLACDYKNGEGCYNLANMYELGEGVQKDLKQAMEFYGISCDYKALDYQGCIKYRELSKANK